MDLSKLLDVAKLPTKFIAVIFIVSLILSVLPEDALTSLQLKTLTEKYAQFFNLATLISGTILLIEVVTVSFQWIKKIRTTAKRKKVSHNHVKNLDPEEKAVLREFFILQRNTLRLPEDNPAVAGLIQVGVLQYTSTLGRASGSGRLFSLKIAKHVTEYLTCADIDFPPDISSDENRSFLINNRPAFAHRIMREEALFNY